MSDFLKKLFHERKRQKLTSISVIFLVCMLSLIGIFSYLHSQDTVTNRLRSGRISLAVAEPAWDSTGAKKAENSAPGMKIEKDPRGLNDGEADMYVCLRMTISGKTPEAIAQAIMFDKKPLISDLKTGKSENPAFIGECIEENKEYLFYYVKNGKMQKISPEEETAVLFDYVQIPVYKEDYMKIFGKGFTISVTAEGLPVTLFDDIPTAEQFGASAGNDEK